MGEVNYRGQQTPDIDDHLGQSQFGVPRMTACLKIAAAAALLSSCSHVVERELSIEAKPVLKKESGYTSLTASQGEIEVSSIWSLGKKIAPAQLDPKKTYRFDLIQERSKMAGIEGESQGSWSSELVRISDGDRVLYDTTVCPVHQLHMTRQTIPISYGFPSYTSSYLKALKTRFPCANSSVLGGCVVGPEKYARSFRCKRCIQEERAWETENPHH